MTLYQNQYRIEPARLKHWDYRNDGAYFVTLCTHNKRHDFGTVQQLSAIGQIAHDHWQQIPEHFPHVRLDAFIIMPNHIHGIIFITHAAHGVRRSPAKNQHMAKIAPKVGSLPTIMRSYKASVTKQARAIDASFQWQSRFHDHIIRNAQSLADIQHYIKTNPQRW